jgi:acyl carrier protein
MELLISIIEAETGQKVSPETSIDTLGLDSLEFMQLLLAIENEAKIEIPESRIVELMTVGDIWKIGQA